MIIPLRYHINLLDFDFPSNIYLTSLAQGVLHRMSLALPAVRIVEAQFLDDYSLHLRKRRSHPPGGALHQQFCLVHQIVIQRRSRCADPTVAAVSRPHARPNYSFCRPDHPSLECLEIGRAPLFVRATLHPPYRPRYLI